MSLLSSGRQHNVQSQLFRRRPARPLVLAHDLWHLVDGHEIDNEVVLDGEDGVGGQPWVILGVNLGDDGFVIVMRDLFKC